MRWNPAKRYGGDPDTPAALDVKDGYAKWTQVALILFRGEPEKSVCEVEDYLSEILGIHAALGLEGAPHRGLFCRWEDEYQMRNRRLHSFSRRIQEGYRRRHWSNGAR